MNKNESHVRSEKQILRLYFRNENKCFLQFFLNAKLFLTTTSSKFQKKVCQPKCKKVVLMKKLASIFNFHEGPRP